MHSELEALSRAHQMFVGRGGHVGLDAGTSRSRNQLDRAARPDSGAGLGRYRLAALRSQDALTSAARTDAATEVVLAGAQRDQADAREQTKNVLDQARADNTASPASPMAQREAMRRRAARLRAQRAHVLLARGRARRRLMALRALRYRMSPQHGPGLAGLASADGRAGIAVRAALSRLGRPYVWGATGPDQFDCSGLVQWSYAQAGLHLDRTTYQQINDGIAVSRAQVRPGDLVFPHAGHVQLAIGNNLVVEAPYSGASVRISPLGGNVQIRRPF
jgi:cell wall-associated NlpC family hydrolase